MTIKFSEILCGAFIKVNDRLAVKLNPTEIMYADEKEPMFQTFEIDQELEIDENES
jgi:hypothetical protein